MAAQLIFDMVQEGSEIPTLVRGPITTRMMFGWSAAAGDFTEIHYDQRHALQEGLPDVIIQGQLKICFLMQMLVNWIGLNGTLRKISVQSRGMDVPGNILTCKGTVVRKYIYNKENLVECEIWLENQKGEKSSLGSAVVALPS
ncbi:acyl dehydratase [Chloroflexota bacterium]